MKNVKKSEGICEFCGKPLTSLNSAGQDCEDLCKLKRELNITDNNIVN